MASPASLKMPCSQLVLDRIDPLVDPGVMGSPHLHQIVGGNAFNATMDPADAPADRASCTTCTFTDDFSNYWTAVMYFQARNGSYRREARNGGMTIYYFPQYIEPEKVKIRAFMSGFRMRTGYPSSPGPVVEDQEPTPLEGITYTCLLHDYTRTTNLSYGPQQPCPEGILTTIAFPPCWDGQNLDSPDHRSHVAYADGDYNQGAACPASHPVHIPEVMLEIRWDTRGRRIAPGDQICELPVQTIPAANECMLAPSVEEDIDGWLDTMPGGVVARDWTGSR
ncbi:hypothetical protein C8A00DRAFT_43844 [Chaetomidium leptoderma]|uniref:DUF1996 domain-containing protein n=1 Tax=Chaetomidium leptoderma TaxID=669021 RepID=A0AAN6ZW95_9PEZI|nr:hypothetical protein C8A00DRAFT_43844 [Chaetomidium leptoderma]